MSKRDAERYRQKAAECDIEAAKATTASAKEAWLQAAEEWRKLARQADENGQDSRSQHGGANLRRPYHADTKRATDAISVAVLSVTTTRACSLAELTRRLVAAAKEQGFSAADLQAEIGDISDYIGDLLKAANRAERERRKPT
ncbi:hypothetical protein [Bradyrhizobium sp. 33ap4]|uniref:hypothetical protein n=1 Tax=Bradyrhizobium sp. 33ap4 TaxID=3061630 RepID=UPI0029316D28|nr:hypothetical protein [Bradyrhizobium sp. 33ap4]